MPSPTRGGATRSPPIVRTLRWVLFAMLAASATLTLVGLPELQRAVGEKRWPPAALALPPAVLAAFIVGFAGYRFVLVRAGRYPAGKAFVQLGLMLLVLGVVAGIARERWSAPAGGPVDLGRALGSADGDARAMAAELLRHRPPPAALPLVGRLVELLDDPVPEVRRQAHETLVALAGTDAGGEGAGAPERWRAYWRRQGAAPASKP